ncbi:hypothetical protein PtrSN002B_003347 [Pyrenophora tritici-repentis]|uniref:Uncharacterized protein n=1 Tax=Pyrenophora tritici-repentis TaxID=45151 RepID=A0A922NR03_9PLEO|nr:hypothetical protein A1F94_000689 [Pyrenophora tritici-repentis]KAI0591066.1 hypothetical protein Alg130_01593 [Pyrenophora tritici-repentis]KAI0618275.1 hypothetical protein TUN199_09727 [Pyrenophora tritici-repentis]KAI1520907.1 hypothetical protein Ptr86124_001275 [Pyrenophora tritici-repentis]KAI1555118.1 hypothetical protein PtrSN002B_003347 [Pyrenophora tritici-repentis]
MHFLSAGDASSTVTAAIANADDKTLRKKQTSKKKPAAAHRRRELGIYQDPEPQGALGP